MAHPNLGPAVVTSSLPDIEKAGIGPDQSEHVVGNEAVVEDEIGALDGANRLERQKLRIARPCPHQCHSAHRRPAGIISTLLPQQLQQSPELGQLQGDVVLPAVAGAPFVVAGGQRVERRGRKRRGSTLVEPGVPLVPL